MDIYLKIIVVYLLFSGLIKSAIIGFFFLIDWRSRAVRHIQILANIGGFFDLSLVFTASVLSLNGYLEKSINFGDILGINSILKYQTDSLSFLYIFFSFLVLGLLGRFSCIYLHRDPRYLKFFCLFYIFQSASIFLILSDSFVSYFFGWELLGLSSVLLISFYDRKRSAVKNSLRVLTYYKISDILLFSGFAVAHSQSHFQLFSELPLIDTVFFSFYVFLVSLAIMIKMGGLPMIWLPRAMEGPTPSSAIFYGALATHVPLLLFIKLWTGAEVSSWVQLILLSVLILIILSSTLLSRTQADAKNSLAYSTVEHLSIISVEVILGFITLAYVHIFMHCFYRLFQFLRSPSLLYEYHQMEGYNGFVFKEPGQHFNFALPLTFRKSLYRFVLREFYIMPRLIRITDVLIGITNRISYKKSIYIFLFNIFLFSLLILIEWITLHQIQSSIFMLAPAWFFALIALLTNFCDWRNLIVISISILSLLSVIYFIDEHIDIWILSAIQLLLLMSLFIFFSIKSTHQQKIWLSNKNKVILFVISLWMVGVPGPGTYFLFEKAIHHTLEKDLYLSIGAFVILSINTLSVIKNFLLEDYHFVGDKICEE